MARRQALVTTLTTSRLYSFRFPSIAVPKQKAYDFGGLRDIHQHRPFSRVVDHHLLLRQPSSSFSVGQRASFVSQTSCLLQSSPFGSGGKTPKAKSKRGFIPRKAAVKLTDKSRKFFKLLLDKPPRPEIIGIMLNYDQSKTGEPRMVFTFDFVTANDVGPQDEGVSLEVLEDGTPKPPAESLNDGLPKLYVNHNAFLKVLGATVDVDTDTVTPVLYDREGNKMDPNA